MSRNKKPLAMQKGNLTVEQQEEMKQAESLITVGREDLEKPPSWLVDGAAKKEFKRIVAELQKVNVVGNLDLNNLAGYCNAYASYLKVTKEMKNKKFKFVVEKPLPKGGTMLAENPLINIQRKYADEMRKFAALCGLTIDSRLKVATVQVHREDGKIEDQFGDI